MTARTVLLLLSALTSLVLAGCGLFGSGEPTRTPFPTFTPTPLGAAPPVAAAPDTASQPQQQQPQTAATPTVAVVNTLPPPPTATVPPTPTPIPPTATSTLTPTPAPTATETPIPAPTATPTPQFEFMLEAAEKFPTESLAPNVVRIFLYAYSPSDLGLPGYTLRVLHNGTPLAVDDQTRAGLPDQTRAEPGPYTRFANMSVIFVEPQAGLWEVELIDDDGNVKGPAVKFELTADELSRELYVRYKRQ